MPCFFIFFYFCFVFLFCIFLWRVFFSLGPVWTIQVALRDFFTAASYLWARLKATGQGSVFPWESGREEPLLTIKAQPAMHAKARGKIG
jgi:hypothetical protein